MLEDIATSISPDPGLQSGMIRIRMSTGSLPKCSGFITSSASVISPNFVKSVQ